MGEEGGQIRRILRKFGVERETRGSGNGGAGEEQTGTAGAY